MGTKTYGQQRRWGRSSLFGLFLWSLLFSLDTDHSWAQTVVAAEQPTATIGKATTAAEHVIEGHAWKDANRDGIYQLEEPFLPYTVVELYLLAPTPAQTPQLSATPLLTTTTTITGSYAFRGLATGTYLLEFTTLGSMYPTTPQQGADKTKDSDVFTTGLVAQARSVALTLAMQGQTLGQLWRIDAGFVSAAQATIYVYDDTNRDNNRQIGEPIVLGAVVILHDSSGREVGRQVVDQRGAALFPDLLPGDYAISVWPPEGYSEDPRAAVALSLAPGANIRLSAPVAAAPKVIDLTAFTIAVEKDELVVRWTTAAEQQTYGYRLLRHSDVSAATAEVLTTEMIASKGTQGGAYEVRLPYRPVYDGPATAMEFWLLEYEITGKEQRYGPFYMTPPMTGKAFLPLVVTLP